jgi:IS30 family transposase
MIHQAFGQRYHNEIDVTINHKYPHVGVEKLKAGWSPEQIAGRIKIDCPGKKVSHEAIYQFVYRRYFQGGEDLRPFLKRRHPRRQRKGDRQVRRLKRHGKMNANRRTDSHGNLSLQRTHRTDDAGQHAGQ